MKTILKKTLTITFVTLLTVIFTVKPVSAFNLFSSLMPSNDIVEIDGVSKNARDYIKTNSDGSKSIESRKFTGGTSRPYKSIKVHVNGDLTIKTSAFRFIYISDSLEISATNNITAESSAFNLISANRAQDPANHLKLEAGNDLILMNAASGGGTNGAIFFSIKFNSVELIAKNELQMSKNSGNGFKTDKLTLDAGIYNIGSDALLNYNPITEEKLEVVIPNYFEGKTILKPGSADPADWNTASSGSVDVTYKKTSIEVPNGLTVTYNGSTHSITNYDSNLLSATTTNSFTDAGSHQVRFEIKDPKMYKWANEDTDKNATRMVSLIITEKTVDDLDLTNIVTNPALGANPTNSSISNSQYTANVTWQDNPTTFEADKEYTAVVTINPNSNHTLTGLTTNSFKHTGAKSVELNSNEVTITFEALAAPTPPSSGGGGSSTRLNTVTFQTNGGSTVDPITSIKSGDTVSLSQVTNKAGYDFLGWYTTSDFTGSPVTSLTVSKNRTVYAKFERNDELLPDGNGNYIDKNGNIVDEFGNPIQEEITLPEVTEPVKPEPVDVEIDEEIIDVARPEFGDKSFEAYPFLFAITIGFIIIIVWRKKQQNKEFDELEDNNNLY